MNENEKLETALAALEWIGANSSEQRIKDMANEVLAATSAPPSKTLPVGIAIACLCWAVTGFVVGREW